MAPSTVTRLLAAFASAPPEHVVEEYRRLTEVVWRDEKPTEVAAAAAPILVGWLDEVPDDRKGYLAILLGLLTEADPVPDGEVAGAVRKGLDRYLELLARHARSRPLVLALVYLVGHFPDAREQILSTADGADLDTHDRSRLDRILRPLDPGDVVLGRVWPSPAQWTLSEAERDHDRAWIAQLRPEQIATAYDGDTRMLLGYCGAKAYWALSNGATREVTAPEGYGGAVPEEVPPFDATAWRRHTTALRCPVCGGQPAVTDGGATCAGCGSRFATTHGVLDLTGPVTETDDPDDVLRNAAVLERIGMYYETVLRPGFLRLMGANWGGEVEPRHEDAHLVTHARPADGPLLDLAAGAGRWTAVLAGALGSERVLALDLNPAMLRWLRRRLPAVPVLRASALSLPFGDATLGAVNCWNALQAMPDPARVISEIGRCLRPGGTFTLLTFRRSDDPVYRYFQDSFRGPGFPDGHMPLFRLEDVRGWIERAGMTVSAVSLPGTFLFVTAVRT